jgi:hypothetical protein
MNSNSLFRVFGIITLWLPLACCSQVNSGSNGSDGALHLGGQPGSYVIDMADHTNGIYQYTSVSIPTGVTVTFIPNANNTPVVWLVQSNCIINGLVRIDGSHAGNGPGIGGPGGYKGGVGGPGGTGGQGPGGGPAHPSYGGNASFGSLGLCDSSPGPGPTYGNIYLLPLAGGSGGGGVTGSGGSNHGGGGGGGILICASGVITISGLISSTGGNCSGWAGAGSGGAIRLVASRLIGNGVLNVDGGVGGRNVFNLGRGGKGRIRLDTYDNSFAGQIDGILSQGFQPIILPTPGLGAQLTVTSVGGTAVSASPTGQLSTPDTILSAQQNNSIPIVVHCANIPLNTQIIVSVKPANGAAVSATGLNNTGTLTSSTATISIVIPRGGGLVYATAATSN